MDDLEKKRIEASRKRLLEKWQNQSKDPNDHVVKRNIRNIDKVIPQDISFWYYSEGDIYIPVTIVSVPSIDKVNTIVLTENRKDDGSPIYISTELYGLIEPWTIEEYHEQFADLIDGKYYYKV